MRILSILILAALAAANPTAAQENEAGTVPGAQPERATGRRPLADVADVEPAVDVSRTSTESRQAEPPPPAEAPVTVARAGPGRAADTLDLGTTSITGNQELPKVLYIVPWKRSDLGDHVGRPVNTLLDEVLEPIDPEVFERHLDYYETLHGVSREE
jgi:hypothetical protein